MNCKFTGVEYPCTVSRLSLDSRSKLPPFRDNVDAPGDFASSRRSFGRLARAYKKMVLVRAASGSAAAAAHCFSRRPLQTPPSPASLPSLLTLSSRRAQPAQSKFSLPSFSLPSKFFSTLPRNVVPPKNWIPTPYVTETLVAFPFFFSGRNHFCVFCLFFDFLSRKHSIKVFFLLFFPLYFLRDTEKEIHFFLQTFLDSGLLHFFGGDYGFFSFEKMAGKEHRASI